MSHNLRVTVFLPLILLLAIFSFAADETRLEMLPSNSYFKPLILDPSAAQSSASLLSYQVSGSDKEKVYSPINVGIQKMIARYAIDEHRGYEFGVEFGIHSQFTIVDTGGTLMGGLQNTDYRIGAMLHYKNFRSVYRIGLFHQSSHLGDDYMLRNDFFQPNSKVLNYEQVDFTHSMERGASRYYYSLGYNFSPNTTRKRLLLQGGYFYSQPFKKNSNAAYLYGLDFKLYEQNEYRPNIKVGAGLEIGRNFPNPFMIILEYYSGHLPYSSLEYQEVNLYGIGIYFHL